MCSDNKIIVYIISFDLQHLFNKIDAIDFHNVAIH